MSDQQDPKNEWKLTSFKVDFHQGFAILNTEDRYEGKITFSNGHHESFTLKITPELSQTFINLMSEQIVDTAETLCKKLTESLITNTHTNP